jgi:predicted Ser/Thr protein kinase
VSEPEIATAWTEAETLPYVTLYGRLKIANEVLHGPKQHLEHVLEKEFAYMLDDIRKLVTQLREKTHHAR